MSLGGPRHPLAVEQGLRALLRLPRRRDRPVPPRPHRRQPPGPPAAHPGGGLPPHRGPRRPGDRLPQGPARLLATTSRSSCTFAPGACHAPHQAPAVVHRAVPRAVRPGLGRVARRGVRPPGRVGAAARGNRAVASGPTWVPAWDDARRRRAPALRPDDGGVRRVPDPHRRAGRPRASTSSSGSARLDNTHRDRDERQRRLGRGRAAGHRSTSSTSSTSSPRASRRTCAGSTTSALLEPTTTTHGAGRGRATRRSSGSSATPTRAASATR